MNWRRLWEWGGGYPLAFVAVAGVIAVCIPFRGQYGVQTFMILFVPVIVIVARFAGTRPSAFASVLAVLTLDFLFTEPYYHLTISDPAEWIALTVFLVVALIAGQQTGRLRERGQAAVRRQRELTLLNRLSFHVVSDKSVGTAAELTVSQVTALLGARRVAVYARSDREKVGLIASTGEQAADDETEFVDWVMQSDKAIGLPSLLSASLEPRPVGVGPEEAIVGRVADGVYLPLQTTEGLEGVLYARTHFDGETPEEDVRFLVAVANLAGAALERKRLEAETAALTLEREAENLKSTIISSVSHELKTPLAAAIARVTALLDEDDVMQGQRIHEELLGVSGDLTRLNAAIVDLVDVSRLESDAWRPQPELYEASEILGTVSSKLSGEQRARIDFDIPDATPYVYVDFSQTARALAHIVENALVYSPEN
ncbi:MAG TPA: DUF4118 domain-containing protein, partial [Coriobacteriia bacterium]|nr:DUF4118 domain-containing protein [Coriobacteriia bacterium]